MNLHLCQIIKCCNLLGRRRKIRRRRNLVHKRRQRTLGLVLVGTSRVKSSSRTPPTVMMIKRNLSR